MIPPISMLKIQELPGAMPLDPHRYSGPGSRSPRSAAIEGLPPASTPSGSGPAYVVNGDLLKVQEAF